MTGDIKIGFTMHPRWVSEVGLAAFADPLRAVGLSVLEFELDDRLDRWDAFGPLMVEAVNNGFDLSFHAPYRLPHNLAGFAGERRKEIQMEYCQLLKVAADWAHWTGSAKTVVIHAAVGHEDAEVQALFSDTIEFLEMALNTYPDLCFALENNHPTKRGQIKIGVSRADILRIVNQINHPRLRICWDMGHDYLSGSNREVPIEWLQKVIHVHVHDVDGAGMDHYPLIYQNVPYHSWLQGLKQEQMKGIVVLELTGELLKGWAPERITTALTDSIRQIAMEIE